jgi:hypothetical protein
MNKNFKIYGGIALAAILGTIIWALFFRHVHTEGRSRPRPCGRKGRSRPRRRRARGKPCLKEVHLNEAQYKTTGLVLGGFEKKNL